MAKRIYWQTVLKKAAAIGIPVGVAGFTLLFWYLSALGVIDVTGYSGDMICAGTESEPCLAYINFTAREDIFIYPFDYDPWGRNTPFETDKGLRGWHMYRSWGASWREIKLNETCKYTWCGAPPNSPDNKYAFAFREGRNYSIKIVAYKEDPTEDIKWGFGPVDPIWYGKNIGYEFLDDGKVVHIWNSQNDYFFDKDSGIQFTNYYQDYWSKNIFCLGYYSGGNWNKIKCADELIDFNKNIESDNQTYVNATLWKDFSYSGYDLRLGVRYHLGLDDKNLSITIYGKNIGIDIPYDLGFAWKVTGLDVPPETIDRISINNTSYKLDGTYDLTFRDMKRYINVSFPTNQTTDNGSMIYNYSIEEVPIPFYKVYDYGGGLRGKERFLRIDWDEDLNYAVKMHGSGDQEDFYTSLLINAGHFSPGQEKSTTFYWIDALTDNLISYWKLDEGSGDAIDSHGNYDGVVTGASYSEIGIINTAFGFDGGTDRVDGSIGAEDRTDISMSLWMNATSYTNSDGHFIIGEANNMFGLMYFDKMMSYSWDGTTQSKAVSEAPATGTYIHWVAVFDSTNSKIRLYKNGALAEEVPLTFSKGLTADWRIGNRISVDNKATDGYIDEIALFNRALTLEDAQNLYNSGAGLPYPLHDATPPTYSNAGVNNTNIGQSTKFYILYDDELPFGGLNTSGQYIFSTNNTGSWENESAVNFTATPEWANVTKTLNSTGGVLVGYRWYADDHVGNVNNTGIYTLTTVDNIIPAVTIITPLNQTYNTTTILFNISATDVGADVDSCWYSLDSEANITMTETYAPYWNATNSSMTQDSHTINYYCNDTFGNLNDTEQVTFFIDSIYPLISIDYPTNTTYTVNVSDLNFTYTEANPDKCWYSKDGGATNLSLQACTSNFTSVVSVEGNNTWIVYINDTTGNENLTSVTFTKDTEYPLIDYAANSDPYNTSGNFDIQDWVFVNVTVTEANEANITFILWTLYGTHNETTYNTSVRTINWTGLSESMYFWNVTVCDIVSQCNTTGIRQYGVEIINVSVEGYFTDLDVELGTSMTINATNTNDTICVDIDHPDYGSNYSCADQMTGEFELLIDYFRKTTFNDSTSSKVYNFSGAEIYNFSIDSHQYDEVDALSVNISGVGSPTDIIFYRANTSFLLSNVDRALHGILNGTNIYLNKFYDDNVTENLTYSNPGEQLVYFYLDDTATSVDFLINVTGIEYGFNYTDNLGNYDYIDKSETTAQLDPSGVIMPANSSLNEFSFDDFEDDSIASYWLKTDDFSYTEDCTLQRTTSETGGYIQQNNYLLDGAERCSGNSIIELAPNNTFFSLYYVEDIAFNVYSTYDSRADNTGCSGNAYADVGGTTIWTSMYLPDPYSGNDQDEQSAANVTFSLTKQNRTHWKVEISGTESSTMFWNDANGGCDTETRTNNWTAGTYYHAKQKCDDVSGSLDNSFYVEMNYAALAVKIWNKISFSGSCEENNVITRTYYMNNTLWSRANATVVSESVFDSSSDIATATLTLYGYNEPGEDLYGYLSADEGEHWEGVTSGVLHTFSNPGKHIKWRIDFNLTNPGYTNRTSRIAMLEVITPPSNVSNVTFDLGDDGIVEFTIEGYLNSTNSPFQVNLSNFNLANAFTSARWAFGNTYKIPLAIETDSAGQINLDTINLTYDPNPIVLNADYIQDYLSGLATDFLISFGSIGGNITISNVKYDYSGGNKTYVVTAHNDDYSINTTRNLTYYYSSFYKNLPYTWTDYIFFLPRTNSSKNVTPHGQTSTIPLFNITATNYGGVNLNLSIRVNESFSCLNLTWNATGSTKPTSQKINTSWKEIASNIGYLSSTSVWFWADLENCNASDQRILSPWLDVGSYCKSCLWGGS